MTTQNTNTLISSILGEIGTSANVLRNELFDSAAAANTSAVANRLYALEALATKIGWMADLGLEKLTGATDIVGDAEDWFMPPNYNDAKKLEGAK